MPLSGIVRAIAVVACMLNWQVEGICMIHVLSPIASGSLSASRAWASSASESRSTAHHAAVTPTSEADVKKSAKATAPTAATVIPESYFGLTVLDFTRLQPSMRFGTTRSWDAWPGLDWSDANPSPGVYNFADLDQFLSINESRGADVIYTFGRTPQWASSQPDVQAPYGPGECAPPAHMSSWDDYVSAIATHAAGRIKYWELWNEPNEANYCGAISTMVVMAQHAAKIIKEIDPGALILSPATDKATGPPWLASFLSQGGAGFMDVIAFHGYWSSKAEDIVSVVSGFRQVMGENGVASLPLWDTESSWAYTSEMPLPTSAEQAAYIAKYYLLHWSAGVTRFAWYAYDGESPWGTLWTSSHGESTASLAYRETYSWMVGATLTAACSESTAKIWTCPLSRSGGYSAEAVWISNSTAKLTVPEQYKEYLDLSGISHQVNNKTVTVSDQPILLETGPLPKK